VDGESPSLFELPVSRRARTLRIAVVLTLDVVLAGAGAAMIASYFNARAEASKPIAHVAPEAEAEAGAPKHEAEVEVTAPRVVRPGLPGEPKTQVPVPVVVQKPEHGKPGTGGGSGTGTGGKPGPGEPSVGEVLGGVARRVDAGVAVTPPPPPPIGPDAGGASTGPVEPPPPPPPAAIDAGVAAPPPDPTDAEQSLANGVQRTVEAHMAQVRRCWENAAKSSSDTNLPEGTVEVEFAVLPTGRPANVNVVQNGTGSDQLGVCVVALVNSWEFPAHDGDPVVFVWPFLFRASK
jgi:TonB family protein